MPNHVAHRIVCTGTSSDVAAFKALMVVEDKSAPLENYSDGSAGLPPDSLSFDFNRIIPMPPLLDRVVSPRRYGPNGRTMLFAHDQKYDILNYETREATVDEQDAIDKETFKDWYSWAINNWDTKWNSYDYGEVSDTARFEFMFNTAWSPPSAVFDQLVERFPGLSFDIAWFDEGWCHAGNGTIGATNPSLSMNSIGVEPDAKIYEKVYGASLEPDEYDFDAQDETISRLAINFTCFNVASASDEKGVYPVSATFYSDDPELSDDELFAIRTTRNHILDRIMETGSLTLSHVD